MTAVVSRVVKVGGSALAPGTVTSTARLLAAVCDAATIVVHGHGKDADRLSAACGVARSSYASPTGGPLKFTSSQQAVVCELASMQAGDRLRAAVAAEGVDVGDGASSARFVTAVRRGRFRYVEDGRLRFRSDDFGGDVTGIRGAAFAGVLATASWPLFVGAVARSPEGETVAIDADALAAVIAGHVRARELIFLTDVPGVRRAGGGEVFTHLSRHDVDACVRDGATGGMRKKLKAARSALDSGVEKVVIGAATRSSYEELVADGTTVG